MLAYDKIHAESGGQRKAESGQGARGGGVQRRMTQPKQLVHEDLDLIGVVVVGYLRSHKEGIVTCPYASVILAGRSQKPAALGYEPQIVGCIPAQGRIPAA